MLETIKLIDTDDEMNKKGAKIFSDIWTITNTHMDWRKQDFIQLLN
jgi:hypothetical protein